MTPAQVNELGVLEPVGMGNPPVQLSVQRVRHRFPPRRIGRENQHVKFSITDGRDAAEVVWWQAGNAPWPEGDFDLAFTPSLNHYNGRTTVQLRLLDWRAAE